MLTSSGRAFKSAFKRNGFTLIELLVVLGIVSLLLTLAMPRYFKSVDASKETVLMENLRTTRDTIDKFHADTGRYPESLDELVTKKYLRSLPIDPITESDKMWIIIRPENPEKGNVHNIKSNAKGTTRDGKPFTDL